MMILSHKLQSLRTLLVLAVVVAMLGSAANRAAALGADHPKGQKVGSSAWSDDLTALVNRDNRVHGYFVNWHDTLFYAGSAKELNDFLTAFAKLGNATKTVYLQTGRGTAASPWKSETAPQPCDWQLDITSGSPSLRIWVNGDVKLEEIAPPPGIVFAQWPGIIEKPDGDAKALEATQQAIRDFIKKHEPTQPATAAPPSTESPVEAPVEASVNGKYRGLLRTVNAPGDEMTYGRFVDSGFSNTVQWAGQGNLPPGYWVYVAPNWYIWQGPTIATPKVDAPAKEAIAYTNAARDMRGRMVTIFLDNGTPVAGRLIEQTDDYFVLVLASGPKKLIYKAKVTSIEWTSETAPATTPPQP